MCPGAGNVTEGSTGNLREIGRVTLPMKTMDCMRRLQKPQEADGQLASGLNVF